MRRVRVRRARRPAVLEREAAQLAAVRWEQAAKKAEADKAKEDKAAAKEARAQQGGATPPAPNFKDDQAVEDGGGGDALAVTEPRMTVWSFNFFL